MIKHQQWQIQVGARDTPSVQFLSFLLQKYGQQECIPVGCAPAER